jgi:hypothetical protein
VAKVDSAAVQDGFDLYLHGFIVTDDGDWVVVQQGMNQTSRQARRYHWLSEGLESFIDSPHAAIEGHGGGAIVNLADQRAERSRVAQLSLLGDLGPDRLAQECAAVEGRAGLSARQATLPHLDLPDHHDVRAGDIVLRRLHGTLAAAAEAGPKDFAELLMVPGVGARTVRSLAFVAEVIHGTPCRFSDPARYSLAHGGKDGHPYPVPIKVYDETIRVLKSAVANAKLGREEKLDAVRRLDAQARKLERDATGPSFEQHLADERRSSYLYGGRTVMGWAAPPSADAPSRREKRDSGAGRAAVAPAPGDARLQPSLFGKLAK